MPIKTIKRPYKISFSGNPIHYSLSSDLAALDASIFFEVKIMFRFFGGSFSEVTTLPFYPTNGTADINVQDLLHSQLACSMPALDVLEPKAPQACPEQTGQFYIAFREITTLDPDPAWDISEMNFAGMVISGGINYFQWRGNNFWVNYFNLKKPFLTWQQVGRQASVNEMMWLDFLNLKETQLAMVARCRVKFTDGTDLVQELLFTAQPQQIHLVPSGAQWNLATLDPSKSIHFWDVQILEMVGDDSYISHSETFRYYADNRPSLSGISLHYRNSLGGLDSVRVVTGLIDESLDYTYTEQNRNAAADYYESHVITAKRIISETLETHTYKGDLGHLGKEEQDRLRDAQLQREVYLIRGTKWLPVNILTKQFKLRSTGDMRFTMPIEFSLGYEGATHYTPASVDLGDAVFGSNVCLAFVDGLYTDTDLESPDADPGYALVTLYGTEMDEQDASTEFRFQIPGTLAWQNLYYAQLPYAFQVPLDGSYLVEHQSICQGDVLGSKREFSFDTYTTPPAPVFPITVAQVSNSGTPGGSRTQVFSFTGVDRFEDLPEGVKLYVQVYSHMVSINSTEYTSQGMAINLMGMLDLLCQRINSTTASEWNSAGSAPAPGTAGFKPTASHAYGVYTISLTLNFANQFAAGGHFE